MSVADAPDVNTINTHALSNIAQDLCVEFEKKLTVLLRNKISLNASAPQQAKFEEAIKPWAENSHFSSFNITSHATTLAVRMDSSLVIHFINMLYGGEIKLNETEAVNCGKIGNVIAEKINRMVVDSMTEAVKEYAKIESNHYRTAKLIDNVSDYAPSEEFYIIELVFTLGEVESKFVLLIPEDFLIKIIPVKSSNSQHREKDFWRTAIKSEVIDSYVDVSTTMADVQIKYSEFLELKEGDEIPISDPTLVYLCLNKLKLFRAVAGQSNSKMVAKIISQV